MTKILFDQQTPEQLSKVFCEAWGIPATEQPWNKCYKLEPYPKLTLDLMFKTARENIFEFRIEARTNGYGVFFRSIDTFADTPERALFTAMMRYKGVEVE